MFFLRNISHYAHILILLFLSLTSLTLYAADKETFKPFVLAEQTNIKMDEAKAKIEKLVKQSPFSIIAEYTPYDDAHIYVITSDELKSLASEAEYGGFAAPQRVSLTKVNNQIQIAYTNPVFMKHAYRMKNVDLQPILDQMTQAFGFEKFFGGDGLTARKLKRYKYSFGLEGFNSFYELPEYDDHVKAIAALIEGFNKKDSGITKVYELKIPGKEQVVFGVAMNEKDTGDEALNTKKTMSIIDHLPLKRTAYLPYEIMVDGNKIIALHARFRIAAYFYDLKMFGKHGFGKLFSTPTAYNKAFTKVSGGKVTQVEASNGFID
ncbi:MAG: hypothetical protein OQL19_02005 [Gammaproteobacteria bacterium]|nr:hypothetical protein [Gammaproteobacteria bacterium]